MATSFHFFTICARNYLAMAAALNESLAVHHPESTFTAFILDRGELPAYVNGLSVSYIEDIISSEEYGKLCCYYDVLELATSLKPRCFQELLSHGKQVVVYLDPDIYFFRPMKEVDNAIGNGAPTVLIPHILSSLPDDKFHPNDLDILRTGIYNLGFLALVAGAETEKFLEWWHTKIRWDCFRDPREGVFVDQKWMDFCHIYLPDAVVLRDTTYNVAYWNLHERSLQETQSGSWLINGSPLTFFHFSGFDPSRPRSLSIYEDRVGKTEGALADLLSFYASRLDAFHHEELVRIEFPRKRFATGPAWDPICRVLYRWKVKNGEKEIDPLNDGAFLSWMASFGPGYWIPRYVQVLLEMRRDVAAAYPDAQGRDWDGVVAWMTSSGAQELGIDRELLAALGIVESLRTSLSAVTYLGYLRSHLGLASAARGYIRALATEGVPLSLIDISGESTSNIGEYPFVDALGTGGHARHSAVEILHVNADEFLRILYKYASRLNSPYRIAIWAWETSDFPDHWADRFDSVDEIWVGSQFMAGSIGSKAPCPVVVMPHVVSVPDPELTRVELKLPEEFLFLTQFDFLSSIQRKNPEAVIHAFKVAFPNDEPVRLIIKTMNAIREPRKMERLKALANDGRIVLWDQALDEQRQYDLLAASDCYISLHRAEGFGLSLAESMAYGKPVIATGWSGNLEFMNVSNSILIPYQLKALQSSDPPYRAGTIWAEPDCEAAAAAMRRVFFDRRWARSMGARAKNDIAERLSPHVIGSIMRARIELIASTNNTKDRKTVFFGTIRKRPRQPWPKGILKQMPSIIKALLLKVLLDPYWIIARAPYAWRYNRIFGTAALLRKILDPNASFRQRPIRNK